MPLQLRWLTIEQITFPALPADFARNLLESGRRITTLFDPAMEGKLSDYDHPETPWHEGQNHDHHEPAEPHAETPDSHPEEPQPKPRAKRSGPRKMVDQPTQRFEGQMYVKQYDQGMQVVNRLKREKSSVPPAERRRLTLNTLVRVAMTVLLEHRQALKGVTEEELLEQFRESLAARAGQAGEH